MAILLTVGVGFSALVHWIVRDLKPQFRVSTEEPLADAAWILAGLASSQMQGQAAQIPPQMKPMVDYIVSKVEQRIAELEGKKN